MTPARFGRALNFGRGAPFPVWRRGETFLFPNALGWEAIFQVDELAVAAEFRGPFMDLASPLLTVISMFSPIQATQTLRSDLLTEIDADSPMPPSRITRDATDHD